MSETIAQGPVDATVRGVCRRCGGAMLPGKAIAQTFGGKPEWPGDTIYTMSPEGPGRLIECLKCEKCGYSISTPNAELKGAAQQRPL